VTNGSAKIQAAQRVARAGCCTIALLMAASCATSNEAKKAETAQPVIEAEIYARLDEDPMSGAAYWGALYNADPNRADAALKYSTALRQLGSIDKSISILTNSVSRFPNDPALMAEYGKALTTKGRTGDALVALNRAHELEPGNWVILSAGGVAYDQFGDHEAAREKYEAALLLAPNNATVLNNLALSYALDGDLASAETHLRRASGGVQSNVQIRQNLALVMGLQGHFDEATRLARADLPPEMAENNVAYLKEMLTQAPSWTELQSMDKAQDGN
jgi:Flp pilus assembly protein TadD